MPTDTSRALPVREFATPKSPETSLTLNIRGLTTVQSVRAGGGHPEFDGPAIRYLQRLNRRPHAVTAPGGTRRRVAWSGSHVGELLQGAYVCERVTPDRRDARLPDPRAARFLVNLPCEQLRSRARVSVRAGSGGIMVAPAECSKVRVAVLLALALLGLASKVDVTVDLTTNIPTGRGFGSSSADIRAALIALFEALRAPCPPDILDYLAVLAEGATNPAGVRPSVFLHRLGVSASLLSAFPSLWVIPFDDDSVADVLTDDHPPAAYNRNQLETFESLARSIMGAAASGNARGVAQIATISASLNDEYLPRRGATSLANLRRLVSDKTGATGFAVSHSGSAGAMLIAPGAGFESRLDRVRRELIEAGCRVWDPYDLGAQS